MRTGRIALEVGVPDAARSSFRPSRPARCWAGRGCIHPIRWQFDARAVEPVRAFALDGNCLRAKCEADHDFGYELVKRFLQQVHMRLERTRLQLLDVYRADR